MSAITINVEKETPTFASALWLSGLLLRVALSGLVFGLSLTAPVPIVAFLAVVALDLAGFVWSIIRYNTAGNTHFNNTGQFWPIAGGYVFFFLSCPLMVALWFLLYQSTLTDISARNTNTGTAEPSYNNSRFVTEISRSRNQLTYKGVIAQGGADEIAAVFDGPDAINTLVLSSPGGNVYEAREMAREVQKRGVNTHVVNECSASCLLVYLAGRERSLGPGAKLGAHTYGLDFAQVLPHVSPLREMREDQQYFLERGVSLRFVEEAFALDRDAIWYPSRQELIAAGVVTGN